MKSIPRLEVRMRRTPLDVPGLAHNRAIRTPNDVHRLAHGLIGDEAAEVFLVFHLDAKNRVVSYQEIGRGGIDSCTVDVPAVLRSVLLAGASSFIVSHNHPSGDPAPSVQDNELTRRLGLASQAIGLTLLDHVVVAHGPAAVAPWYSYREADHPAIAMTGTARELAAERSR